MVVLVVRRFAVGCIVAIREGGEMSSVTDIC